MEKADFFTGFFLQQRPFVWNQEVVFWMFFVGPHQRITTNLADVMFVCFVCFDQLHHHFWMQNLLSLLTNRSQVVWIDADVFFFANHPRNITSWWLNHPCQKYGKGQIGSFRQVGVKIKNIWNHLYSWSKQSGQFQFTYKNCQDQIQSNLKREKHSPLNHLLEWFMVTCVPQAFLKTHLFYHVFQTFSRLLSFFTSPRIRIVRLG